MRMFLITVILLLMPFGVTAQDRVEANPDIEAVIQGQLDAFSTGNVLTAWTFASPTIQLMFQHPTYFGAMVERGYPMVWQPGETTFLGRREKRVTGWFSRCRSSMRPGAGICWNMKWCRLTAAGALRG